MRVPTIAFAGVLAALACAGAPAAAQDVVPEQGERRVQWPVGVESMTATAARVFPAGAGDAFAASPVPVLAPAGLTSADRDAFSNTFGATADGFYAVIPRGAFDVVLNGTVSYVVSPALIKEIPRDGFTYLYEEGDAGTNISFNRFGADYLLEFECRDAINYASDCVTEQEAVELADSLVIVGGGGR
ncbi:MAG: hypothetical protein MI723_13080 [Caulobacterales bacterium]|nr:hypothetical protein [Caulobacterales bacterium]